MKCQICGHLIEHSSDKGRWGNGWIHSSHVCECGHVHELNTNHEAKGPDSICKHCGQDAKVCNRTGGIYGLPCGRF